MGYLLHDVSRIALSLLGIASTTINSSKNILKDKVHSCLTNYGFVSSEDFNSLLEIIREIKVKQNQMEEKLHNKEKNS